MKQQKNNVQKWCALFAEIPVPKSLILTILQNETSGAERIIWQHLHQSWLPPRGANLPELRELMPKIRPHLPDWLLDEDKLLILCLRPDAAELLKLYIIYNGTLPENILPELQTHPEKEEMFRLYAEWKQPDAPKH